MTYVKKKDVLGREIILGDILEAYFYNGERYRAVLKVVTDPADGHICLEMLEGNEKAMALNTSFYPYQAFPMDDEKTGWLRKGKIINR